MQNRFSCLAAAALGILALGPAMAQNSTANRLTTGDSTFADAAARGGLAEVKLGELAQTHAASQAVKNFGQRMITDHTKANDNLKAVAGKEGITLPSAMDSKDQATYDRLSKLNGVQFDRDYMADMVKDHKVDIAAFQHEADDGSNPGLKNFASQTLPVLREHLSLAEQTDSQVKK